MTEPEIVESNLIGLTIDGRVVIETRFANGNSHISYMGPDRARWLAQDLILNAYRAELIVEKVPKP